MLIFYDNFCFQCIVIEKFDFLKLFFNFKFLKNTSKVLVSKTIYYKLNISFYHLFLFFEGIIFVNNADTKIEREMRNKDG